MKEAVSALRRRLPAIAFSLKLVITFGLLGYLWNKVNIPPVLAQIRVMKPVAAIGATLVLLLQFGLISLRWQCVNRLVGTPMDTGRTFQLTLIGHFFNQVVPSGLAGDAARAWLASRGGVQLGRVVTSIVCDRIVGLLVLMSIIALTFLALPGAAAERIPDREVFRSIAFLTLVGLGALLLLGAPVARLLLRSRVTEPLGKLMRDLHTVLSSRAASAVIVLLAGVVHVVTVAVVYVCAKGMNIDLDFASALAVIPAVMLVAMAPISFAGWGVREGAMIVGLGLLGIAAADALAVSIAYGFLQVVLGLPGGVLWLARRRTARAGVVQPDGQR